MRVGSQKCDFHGGGAGGRNHRGRQPFRALGHHSILRVPRRSSAVPHHQPHQGADAAILPEVSPLKQLDPSLTFLPFFVLCCPVPLVKVDKPTGPVKKKNGN